MRVTSGLDEVFSEVDRAIVLEDDCVPNEDFFSFCASLLHHHQDNRSIAAITGDNFQDGVIRGRDSYYFSKYAHVWGWATWRRSWEHYDAEMAFWPALKGSPNWIQLHPRTIERRYWERVFDRVFKGEVDTWDYQWQAGIWHRGGLTATPNANLVENVGFNPDATHTKTERPSVPAARLELRPFRHPIAEMADKEADHYTFAHHFGGQDLRWHRRVANRTRRQVRGALRALKAR